MEEIRKLDLGELKDAKAELMEVVGEKDEDKMDSISNRVKEPSTFTKMTSKSQIEDLKAQLE